MQALGHFREVPWKAKCFCGGIYKFLEVCQVLLDVFLYASPQDVCVCVCNARAHMQYEIALHGLATIIGAICFNSFNKLFVKCHWVLQIVRYAMNLHT
jgi:hypothetical protein